MSNPTKLPGIGKPPISVDAETRRYLEALSEALQIRLGLRGDPIDRAITLRELIDSGLAVSLKAAPFDPNNLNAGNADFGVNDVVDTTTPPVPTNFSVVPAYSQNILSWDYPRYNNHSFSEIYGHDSDAIGDAQLIGVSTGRVYIDPVGSGVSRYYWIRHVSQSSVLGPWNSGTGTLGQTALNVDMLLDELEASIPAVAFAAGLEPISVVSTLPAVSGYTGPSIVLLSTDGKLYRFVNGAWTAAVATVDLTGTIASLQIADDAVTNAKIAVNAIQGDVIAANAITGTKISNAAITTPKLGAGAVTASTIAANAITAAKILAGTITASEIATNAITAVKINADAITANKIATNAVTADAINAGAITAGAIAAGAINASNLIVSGTIIGSNIASNAITAAKIQAGAIGASEIAANAVTASKILANTVDASKIRLDNSTITSQTIGGVPTVVIKNLGVGNAKIQNLAVSTLKIQDQAVTFPVSNTTVADQTLTQGGGYQTVQSITHAATGAPIEIAVGFRARSQTGSTGRLAFFGIFRGSTQIFNSGHFYIPGTNGAVQSFLFSETPSSGTYTYTLKVFPSALGSSNLLVSNAYLRTLETKK